MRYLNKRESSRNFRRSVRRHPANTYAGKNSRGGVRL